MRSVAGALTVLLFAVTPSASVAPDVDLTPLVVAVPVERALDADRRDADQLSRFHSRAMYRPRFERSPAGSLSACPTPMGAS